MPRFATIDSFCAGFIMLMLPLLPPFSLMPLRRCYCHDKSIRCFEVSMFDAPRHIFSPGGYIEFYAAQPRQPLHDLRAYAYFPPPRPPLATAAAAAAFI